MEENQDAVRVYMVCHDQVITSFAGAVALDLRAIEIAMKRCGVKDKNRVFFQVQKLGRHFISKAREESNAN